MICQIQHETLASQGLPKWLLAKAKREADNARSEHKFARLAS